MMELSLGQYETIVDTVPLHIIVVDTTVRLQMMNACFRNAFPQAKIGDALFSACYDCPPVEPNNTPLMRALLYGQEESGRLRTKQSGHEVFLDVNVKPLRAADGTIIGAICIGNDVTERLALEKEAQKQRERFQNIVAYQDRDVDYLIRTRRELTAKKKELEQINLKLLQLTVTDSLTKLNNRRVFDDNFEREIHRAERYSRALSLIFADIDHFRDFNNNYDYDTGDAVLQTLAEVMKAVFRDTDILVRYGGEEFVVILPETDFTYVHRIAERLRKNVENAIVHSKHGDLSVTVSIGTATVCHDRINPEQFLNLAVAALHEAKNSGRNCIVSKELKNQP